MRAHALQFESSVGIFAVCRLGKRDLPQEMSVLQQSPKSRGWTMCLGREVGKHHLLLPTYVLII